MLSDRTCWSDGGGAVGGEWEVRIELPVRRHGVVILSLGCTLELHGELFKNLDAQAVTQASVSFKAPRVISMLSELINLTSAFPSLSLGQ